MVTENNVGLRSTRGPVLLAVMLSTGLIATTNNLVIALKRYDEEIATIPLTEYRLDRRL